MMKKFLVIAAIILVGGTAFTGCTKDYITNTTVTGAEPYTMRFTLTQSSWQYDSNNDYYYVALQDPNLTADITDNGAVFIYISLDGGNSFELLPSMYNNGYDFMGAAGDGGFTIYAYPNGTTTTAPSFTIDVKEVNIPSSLQNQTTGVNFSDYNAVKKAFHLKD
jgi:hypothetical protein